MKLLLFTFFSASFVCNGQYLKNINFETELSWDQILLKAKAHNKFIFIDCYATWCGPCKKMDKEVFQNDEVTSYINNKFISVKMQLDTSVADESSIVKNYQIASYFKNKFDIKSFPTFLFFSPNGYIIHRDIGYKDVNDFLVLLGDVQNPNKQYYTLIQKYKSGSLSDYTQFPYIAKVAKKMGDSIAYVISEDYIENYLIKLDADELYTKDNLEFMIAFTKSSSGKSFNLFFSRGARIDSTIQHEGFSRRIVDYIIFNEDIAPFTKSERLNRPRWRLLFRNLESKYGFDIAERNILDGKITWYKKVKAWHKYTKWLIFKVEKYGVDAIPLGIGFNLNNYAWEVFLHSNKRVELETALAWSDSAIRRGFKSPNSYDTYANILYKLKRTKEAIQIEEEALLLDATNKEIARTLQKMKKGEMTW